jgi:hypothetical protein
MGKGVRTLDTKSLALIRIMQEHAKLQKKPYVKVGYPAENSQTEAPKKIKLEDAKNFAHETLNLIDVVIYNEFGTRTVPERSWVRATHDEIIDEIRDYIADLVGQIYDGTMTVDVALSRVALKVISKMKDKIRSNIPPKLSIETIRRKGSSTALIDTGQLLNGMTFALIMKGK